jgi:hypothetical protein
MSVKPYTPVELAVSQLDTALDLYLAGIDYIAVITLAGAAEEILGHIAKSKTGTNALTNQADILRRLHEIFEEAPMREKDAKYDLNLYKNLAKHADHKQSPVIYMDAKDEAADMLERAIENYKLAVGQPTDKIERFLESRLDLG